MENEFSVLHLSKSSAETSIIPYAISFLTAQFKKLETEDDSEQHPC